MGVVVQVGGPSHQCGQGIAQVDVDGVGGTAADGDGQLALKVINCVGQVGALGVVEVDDVVLNINLDSLLIASARSISVVLDGLVTGYRDRCLCNSITVGLVADGLGRGESRLVPCSR